MPSERCDARRFVAVVELVAREGESQVNCPKCQKPVGSKSRFCKHCGASIVAEVEDPSFSKVRVGDVFEGKWRIESKLGQGGMGAVFLAHDIALERQVAIKILAGELCGDGEFAARFEREAKLTAKLEHPNIVPIYAVGRFGARPFIVMKVLEGKPLGKKIRETKGGMPVAELMAILKQLCDGLGFIHAKGFVHRDIKSANIHLSAQGHATILDFGIIRDTKESEGLTRAGMLMGTPHYMAPEQAMGKDIDARTDLYALGCMVYEMFTGHLPFISDSDYAIIAAHVQKPPPNLCDERKDVPTVVGKIVQKMLAKDPAARYQTAQELYEALEKGLRLNQPQARRSLESPQTRRAKGQTPTALSAPQELEGRAPRTGRTTGRRPAPQSGGNTPARGTVNAPKTPVSRRVPQSLQPAQEAADEQVAQDKAATAASGGGAGKIFFALFAIAVLAVGAYVAAHQKPEFLPPALVEVIAPSPVEEPKIPDAPEPLVAAPVAQAEDKAREENPAAASGEPNGQNKADSGEVAGASDAVAGSVESDAGQSLSAEEEAKIRAEAEAKIRAETEAKVRAELEAELKAKAKAEAAAKAEAERPRAPTPRAPPPRAPAQEVKQETAPKAVAKPAPPKKPKNTCPAGRPASLRILTTPTWGTVSVDGTPWGDTPITREIDSGMHRIRVRRGGYEEAVESVCVRAGDEPTVVTVKLKK